ncbi:hypothetical protein, partial [Klebsiella michiganensis]|uniref:hypothetical protein n=1 Tax=Klebsiella michiganensis TaxID=1134687 RepID=UPI001CCD4CEA
AENVSLNFIGKKINQVHSQFICLIHSLSEKTVDRGLLLVSEALLWECFTGAVKLLTLFQMYFR